MDLQDRQIERKLVVVGEEEVEEVPVVLMYHQNLELVLA
jgi:hypothetical protein